MKVVTKWQGKRAFTAKGDSGYEIQMDATEAYFGEGKGVTPTEMLLASVAGCIGIDVTMILRPHLDLIEKLEIETDETEQEEKNYQKASPQSTSPSKLMEPSTAKKYGERLTLEKRNIALYRIH
jgi:uncharacterized OsmC-like protein